MQVSSKFKEKSSTETKANATIQTHINSVVRNINLTENVDSINTSYEIDCIIYETIRDGTRTFSTAINRRLVPKEEEDLWEQNIAVHDFQTADKTYPRKWILYENSKYREISERNALRKAEKHALIVVYSAVKI